jgi:hypothetical protein
VSTLAGAVTVLMFLLGLAAALVATALFNAGLALRALEARAVSKALNLRIWLLVCLARRAGLSRSRPARLALGSTGGQE